MSHVPRPWLGLEPKRLYPLIPTLKKFSDIHKMFLKAYLLNYVYFQVNACTYGGWKMMSERLEL